MMAEVAHCEIVVVHSAVHSGLVVAYSGSYWFIVDCSGAYGLVVSHSGI